MHNLFGMKLIIDPNLKMRRTWWERLFSRPWKPFEKWKPDEHVYMLGNELVVCPAIAEKLREAVLISPPKGRKEV